MQRYLFTASQRPFQHACNVPYLWCGFLSPWPFSSHRLPSTWRSRDWVSLPLSGNIRFLRLFYIMKPFDLTVYLRHNTEQPLWLETDLKQTKYACSPWFCYQVEIKFKSKSGKYGINDDNHLKQTEYWLHWFETGYISTTLIRNKIDSGCSIW